MSRIPRVPCEGLTPGRRALDAAQSRYVTRVHRLRAGDELLLFDPEARVEARATVIEADTERTQVAVSTVQEASAVGQADVTLLQGLGKGDKLEEVVRAGTALGLRRVVAVETSRAVVKLGQRGDGRLERWRAVALDAARQCGRGDLPEITGPVAFEAALLGARGRRFVLEPRASVPFRDCLRDWSGEEPLTLLIGPEGGFSTEELQQAEGRGFAPVCLGRFVLRTELAAIVAAGVISVHLG